MKDRLAVTEFTIWEADRIAYIAHGAMGQTRTDNVTAYIAHPRRVCGLIKEWHKAEVFVVPSLFDVKTMMCAALLHDVIEDTSLTAYDLLHLNVPRPVVEVVERLTKPHDGPSPPSYYQGIAEHDLAIIVKCADRASNLEDALAEVVPGMRNQRWKNYVQKTYDDVLPMYASLPKLRAELTNRLDAIKEALLDAPSTSIAMSTADTCTECGKNGHEAEFCPALGGRAR
jgi:(p)ppGpp synthase/HD superfamily hydrolase